MYGRPWTVAGKIKAANKAGKPDPSAKATLKNLLKIEDKCDEIIGEVRCLNVLNCS